MTSKKYAIIKLQTKGTTRLHAQEVCFFYFMPRIDDPEEYALIKKMYFNNDEPANENVDNLEKLDRSQARIRNKNKNSR